MNPKDTLDTILGYLGFAFEITETPDEHGVNLQVYTNEGRLLIGRNGDTLEHLQILVNKVCQARDKEAPKVHLDVEHYRSMRDDKLVARAQLMAESVRRTGRVISLDPMNAYDRRLVHNAFKDDPFVKSESPAGNIPVKRITLRKR